MESETANPRRYGSSSVRRQGNSKICFASDPFVYIWECGRPPDGRAWILTVPRVGYHLLSPLGLTNSAVDPPTSLAVMPFGNLSGDPQQEYFVDGVVEDVITALSRFRSFAVIARNSSFVYKRRPVDVRQVATQLGVRYVLEGRVRNSGKRLRVTAQLVDRESGVSLWADSFDGAIECVRCAG